MSDVEPIRDPHEIRRILEADCTPQPGATMTTYLGPVRDELDRLRAALAAADRRITDLTTERDSERTFLKQRSDAVNRVSASNDTLRAQIARVASLAKVQAISCQAQHRADHARNWLDVLAILGAAVEDES